MKQLNEQSNPRVSPWLIILLTAPVPLILCVLFFYKWYSERTDFSEVTSKFVKRQNQVMAFDAMAVSRDLSNLLNGAAADALSLSLVKPQVDGYKRFYGFHHQVLSELDTDTRLTRQLELPLYRTIAFVAESGDEAVRLQDGRSFPKRKAAECLEEKLCDRPSRTVALKLKPGDVHFGNLMRSYVSKDEKNRLEVDVLTVYARTPEGVVELGIDYRHILSILFAPTFPYQAKTDLLHAYANGNYIYFVDSQNDILVHPKYWHVTGIDMKTKRRVDPVVSDEDSGTGRLNVSEYKGEKLREYFKRLLTKSFVHKSVDIFRAPNLGGTNRVLSVAPVMVRYGQFKETGVFGHVIIGCNVEYFEEPTEQFIPYY